jgi:hypothetical protein
MLGRAVILDCVASSRNEKWKFKETTDPSSGQLDHSKVLVFRGLAREISTSPSFVKPRFFGERLFEINLR